MNKIFIENLAIFVIVYLNYLLIYIKNPSQALVNIICYILDQLTKHKFFMNVKKYCFHKNKVGFFGYIIIGYRIRMKDKKIKAIKKSLKSYSIHNI